MTTSLSQRENLILVQMGNVVPREAIGYIADLQTGSATPEIHTDRLKQLARYCPELVAEYREAYMERLFDERDKEGKGDMQDVLDDMLSGKEGW